MRGVWRVAGEYVRGCVEGGGESCSPVTLCVCVCVCVCVHMWQFRVKIEGYSVTYFDCIAAFKVLYC